MAIFVVAVIVALICSGSASAATDHSHHEVLDGNGDFTLSWKFDDVNIEFEAQAKTRGWLGLGLSPNGGMPGSDIVIGWVKDGQAYLTDRYAEEKALPELDESQDWELLSGYENDTHTVLRFKRKLQTCDDRDRLVTKDTLRLLWAWNDQDPEDQTGPSGPVYHGSNRGVRSSALLRSSDIFTGPMPDNYLTHDVVVNNVTIPTKRTTYWCKLLEMPKLERKHHIFKVKPFITPGNEGMVHHIIVYKCHVNPNRTEAPHEHPGHECYTPNMPQDWKECYAGSAIGGWAVGTGDLSFPEHVGFPIGDEDDGGQVLIEMHYDNPQERQGVLDHSGLTFLYTPDLRQYDADMIGITQTVDQTLIVPPYADEYKMDAFCNPECLDAFLDELGGEIHVFADQLHSHLLGRKMRTRLIRDGVELPVFSRDDNYDFNLQYYRMLDEEVTIKKGDTIMVECTYGSAHKTQTVYGGLGTDQEMCQSALLYYPKMNMGGCSSRPTPMNVLSFAGVEEIGSEIYTQPLTDIPVVKPAHMAGMTYGDVVQGITWNKNKAQQFREHLKRGNFSTFCSGSTKTNVNTALLNAKEMPLPKPERIQATVSDGMCSAGSSGPMFMSSLILMTVIICSAVSVM